MKNFIITTFAAAAVAVGLSAASISLQAADPNNDAACEALANGEEIASKDVTLGGRGGASDGLGNIELNTSEPRGGRGGATAFGTRGPRC